MAIARPALCVVLGLVVAASQHLAFQSPLAESPPGLPGQLAWNSVDTLAVLGGGPTWSEPPFYRVSDAVLDNQRNIVFLANGGDGELILYDIGSASIDRIGKRGRGPGEFRRPLWVEPYGPDSLLVYDRDLIRFSVFSRSGAFGRIFRLRGTGLRGRQPAAVTQMGDKVWVARSSGPPQALMMVDTPPGAKARDTVTVLEITREGSVSNTVARVPHGLWERLADTTSFNVRRDEYAAWATISAGGGRLFTATFGDSLEVSAHRVDGEMGTPATYPVPLTGLPRRSLRELFASREGSLWVGESAGDSTVFHVFGESSDTWYRTGTLTLQGAVRILDVSRDRAVFLHLDALGQETVVVARAGRE